MNTSYPAKVKIVEVGPRDGLQNEDKVLSSTDKIKFIHALANAGLEYIEVAAFVHPKAVPQMANSNEVIEKLYAEAEKLKNSKGQALTISALVPNMHGLEAASQSGIKRIAVFTAASEEFVKNNINMTIQESLDKFKEVVQNAKAQGMTARAYISTAFDCPYTGKVPVEKVLEVTKELNRLGVDEISIGDTTGAATPKDVNEVLTVLLQEIPKDKIALHFHDTYGTAIANVVEGLRHGITTFDSSAGGLGGCPYAPGASGNLATEDLIYLLEGLGIETGVNQDKLANASEFMQKLLGKKLPSKNLQRLLSKKV